jgi:hypothetical protein
MSPCSARCNGEIVYLPWAREGEIWQVIGLSEAVNLGAFAIFDHRCDFILPCGALGVLYITCLANWIQLFFVYALTPEPTPKHFPLTILYPWPEQHTYCFSPTTHYLPLHDPQYHYYPRNRTNWLDLKFFNIGKQSSISWDTNTVWITHVPIIRPTPQR